MQASITIRDLLAIIRTLPSDSPVKDPTKWYLTQKQHWIGWLSDYGGPGAYGRKTEVKRDARYAYNHIVEPKMLVYLAQASGLKRSLLLAAMRVLARRQTLMEKSAAIRKMVPWKTIALALWKDTRGKSTIQVSTKPQNINVLPVRNNKQTPAKSPRKRRPHR